MRVTIAIAVLVATTACAPPAPATPAPPSTVDVSFATADGVTLSGHTYGDSGTTWVVLSNMGDNDPAPWQAFAPELTAKGYRVLTYSFRYPLRTDEFTPAMAAGTVPDLQAAIAYARDQGARRIVLVGASLGGITAGKVAAAAEADALVVLSAGPDLSAYGLVVSGPELDAVRVPKLFIASADDTTVPLADTRAYFEHAPEPKQFVSYPGSSHGVRILDGPHAQELRTLLVGFITAAVPASAPR